MRFTALFTALFAAVAFAATKPNSFTMEIGFSLTAGKPFELTWNNQEGSTVTIFLREGNSADLHTIMPIAKSIPNEGSYTWTPPIDTVRATDYVFMIQNDEDTGETNYSAYFTLESDVSVSSTTSMTSATSTTKMTSTTDSTTKTSETSTTETTETSSSSSSKSSGNSTMTMTTTTNGGPSSTGGSQTTSGGSGGPGGNAPTDAAVALNRNGAGMLALAIAGAVVVI